MLKAANNAQSVLAQAINATVTSFSVVDGSSFPDGNFLLSADDEIMLVGTRSGNAFSSITRGYEGTTAAAHVSGTAVENRFTAGAHMELVEEINNKADNNRVLTDVPANAKFTDTVTTINGKTGAIAKADITALGIPAQDTVYTHPATHPASMITDLPTGKKVARFVVGTSTAGWTAADCDYLCDGTADQTEINNAITALPATGGEVVILDGTYNIAAKIDVTKDNVSIKGNGNATILKRMFNSTSAEGVITLTGRSGCKIANLQVDGNKTSYTDYKNHGIYISNSSNNTVTGNTCNNNNYGIYLYSSNSNTVTGNTCIRGTGLSTDYTASQHTIWLKGTGNSYNLISNNNCMGKAVTSDGGTGNTLVNNKYDAT